MTYEVLKVLSEFQSAMGNQMRVVIFRREDGTFGFGSEKFSDVSATWHAVGGNKTFCGSAETAETEALADTKLLTQ
jgi:hypothetical protein